MDHTWETGSHLEKWVTLRLGHSSKNGSHPEKLVTFEKMDNT